MGDTINPLLKENELTLADIQQILPVSAVQKLTKIYLCGNYGEPIVAIDCLKVVKYLRDANPNVIISINTNGSARSRTWWRELADIIGHNGVVRFGIDGLKDTNQLYRQHSDFDLIMSNASAFIQQGGHAHWDYLVFEHNEHQVDAAKQMSIDIGFESFTVKATTRFREGSRPVMNKGVVVHYIKPTSISKYYNPAIEFKKENFVPIECKTLKNNEVYISADGYVFPCCWVAGQIYSYFNETARNETIKWVDSLGGFDAINGNLHDIFEIDKLIYNSLKETWGNTPLLTCQYTCGLNVDKFNVQFK